MIRAMKLNANESPPWTGTASPRTRQSSQYTPSHLDCPGPYKIVQSSLISLRKCVKEVNATLEFQTDVQLDVCYAWKKGFSREISVQNVLHSWLRNCNEDLYRELFGCQIWGLYWTGRFSRYKDRWTGGLVVIWGPSPSLVTMQTECMVKSAKLSQSIGLRLMHY